MRTFAYGAYGTNNVGDEAIFEGLLRETPECIQIYHNRRRFANSIWITDVLNRKFSFEPGDNLILGGGGLFYSLENIETMIQLAQQAKNNRGAVEIQGVGCEAAQPEYYSAIRTLIRTVDTVTVRTTTSQELLRNITGVEFKVRNDFALSLADEIRPLPSDQDDFLNIGLVTSGDVRLDQRPLCSLLQKYTFDKPPIRFFHIPHSRAFSSPYNNDCITGEFIWSSMEIYYGERERRFILDSFTADPRRVLMRYRKLDGVMSLRFHGMIFGHMLGLPILSLWSSNLKSQSFLRDFRSASTFQWDGVAKLENIFIQFLEQVSAHRVRKNIASQLGVDENWYVQRYPDVKKAIESGNFRSATEHFEIHGAKEGRLPSPDVDKGKKGTSV